VRIRTEVLLSERLELDPMGNRPCSSGMRSVGFDT